MFHFFKLVFFLDKSISLSFVVTRCHRELPSHCPRCHGHSSGFKVERFCESCRLKMTEPEDIQLPEIERFQIINSAKKRQCESVFVEDDTLVTELAEVCEVQ